MCREELACLGRSPLTTRQIAKAAHILQRDYVLMLQSAEMRLWAQTLGLLFNVVDGRGGREQRRLREWTGTAIRSRRSWRWWRLACSRRTLTHSCRPWASNAFLASLGHSLLAKRPPALLTPQISTQTLQAAQEANVPNSESPTSSTIRFCLHSVEPARRNEKQGFTYEVN